MKSLNLLLFLTLTPLIAIGGATKYLKRFQRPSKVAHYPKSNPYSYRKKNLGKHIFYDPRLSVDGKQSCASCHNPSLSYQDGLSIAHTTQGPKYNRATPTLLNISATNRLFWDGRVESLEELGFGPVGSSQYVHPNINEFYERMKLIKGYTLLFKRAFRAQSEPVTKENIAKALATFVRSITSTKAPFDSYAQGKSKAISKNAVKGFKLFRGKAKCVRCHSGWNFTDYSFQDIGLKGDDLGRGAFLKLASLQHSFKTPGLRNIQRRAPYMHNGSLKTLEDVVEYYNKGGDESRESKSPHIVELALTDQEIKNIVLFLKTLTSADTKISIPNLPLP